MCNAKLIWITPEPERTIAWCARVSSNKRDNPAYRKLFEGLIKRSEWSPFEMASACIELTTTRAISAQLIRHRSFSFQERSQRWNSAVKPGVIPAGGTDLAAAYISSYESSLSTYNNLLARGVPSEQARSVLPLGTPTTVLMSGTVRSWIHYLHARLHPDTQSDHRNLADDIRLVLAEYLPVCFGVAGLSDDY